MLFNDPTNNFFTRAGPADRKVKTLGPRGTSSYAAAERFVQRYPSDIALFPTYEDAADALRSSPRNSALIVANAYALINHFWTIKRHWRGVLLRDVLELGGIELNDPTLYLRQVSNGTTKGRYDTTIHLQSAITWEAILAYEVDGAPLTLETGFPLRLIDFGLFNYKCVKALRSLEVTRINELGYWEKHSGYDLDGTVQAKKYYAVDLQRKVWFGGTGEVKDTDL